MDTIYSIDIFISRVLYKLRVKTQRWSHQQIVMRYVKRSCKSLPLKDYQYPEHFQLSKKAWVFWAQGYDAMPQIVKCCFESIKKNCGEFEVTLLDLNNVGKYVDIPDNIFAKVKIGLISLTHFSDILRFSLLYKWGGYYLDATIFATSPLVLYNKLYTIKHPFSNEYISHCQWTGFFWYMPEKHPMAKFLHDFLFSYWGRNELLIDYFLIDYVIRYFYINSNTFREEIDSIPMSSPELYFFQSDSCEMKFDEHIWMKIRENTLFFKNNWKKEMKKISETESTYYGMLIDGKL